VLVNRTPARIAAVLLSLSLIAAACGSDDDEGAADAPAATTAAADDTATTAAAPTDGGSAASQCGDGSFESLVAAAEAEGQVNLIALPDTWANYAGILESFRTTYDVEAPVANPDASSADEITAINTLRGQPDMPEAVDVGPSFTSEMMSQGLLEAVQALDLGRDPRFAQGPRRPLGRRVLRRHGDRDERHAGRERADDLGGPHQARVRGPWSPSTAIPARRAPRSPP
jgi:hypothetical protein